MPNERPGQPTAETSQPSGWILCGLYSLLTAVLGAACVMALDLLWTFLLSITTTVRDGFVVSALSTTLSMAAVTSTFMLVYLIFRIVFHLRPLSLGQERENAFTTACLVIVAYLAFLLAYVLMTRQAGVTKKELDPNFLGAVLAYVVFLKWPLWNLLNPLSDSNKAPDRSR